MDTASREASTTHRKEKTTMNESIVKNEKDEITDEAVTVLAMKVAKAIKEEGSITIGGKDGYIAEVNTIFFYDGEWYASNGEGFYDRNSGLLRDYTMDDAIAIRDIM
jgi:hypothetical protein